MSLTNLTTKANYAGNGVATVFPFTFKVFLATDLVVTETTAGGVTSTLVLNTDYTVTGLGLDAGGSITRMGATSPPPTGTTGLIRRVLPLTQTADIRNQSAFYAATHEDVFDKHTMVDQQQEEEIGRCLQLPEQFSAGISNQLPAPLANASLVWDPTATFLQNGTSGSTAFETLNPAMDGTATPGVRGTVSRGDHAHPTDTSRAPNTFTQAGAGAVARVIQDKLREQVSVMDFGAKGDGVTDDTAAIQAALTAAANAGTVLLPETTSNTYLVSSALKFYPGQTLKGAGGVGINTGGTIIRLTAASTSVIEPNTPGTTTFGFNAEGIYFDAQGNAPCAVKFYNTSHSTLKNIAANCTTNSGAAILLDANVSLQTYFNVLENCRAYGTGTGGAGIRFQNGANVNTVIGGRCGSGNYYGLDFLSSSSGNNVFGMDLEGATTAAVHVDAGANNFHGLHIESTPIGFSITANGSNTGIVNPTMASTVTTPISDASVLGNRIYSTPDSNSTAYLRFGSFNGKSVYLSGSSTWDFDPSLVAGTSNAIIHWLLNTNTSGTKQFTIYNGDGTSNFGFQYSPNSGTLLCTAFGTANQVIAASGDFRLKSTGTIKARNNANSADITLVSKNASDAGLFGDINNPSTAQNKWTFTAQTALNAGGINIPGGVAPTTPVAGDEWNDTAQQAFICFVSGIKQAKSGVIFTATATAVVANTASETSIIGTGVGTKTLPANFFVAGKTLRVKVAGIFSNLAAATLDIKVKLGTTVILDSAVTALVGTLTNTGFEVECGIVCRTTGASGTVIGSGEFGYDNGTTRQSEAMVNTAAVTIDTTASQVLDVTATWGGASASNTISGQLVTIEVLN